MDSSNGYFECINVFFGVKTGSLPITCGQWYENFIQVEIFSSEWNV